jgi:hypothetical protein
VRNIGSAAITIAGAAIFYIAGWVYEAHWYGYYGVEVSQLDIAPHIVMIQGVPGIVFLAIMGAISLALFSFAKLLLLSTGITKEDLPGIILNAYILCFCVLVFLAIKLSLIGTGGVPWEVWLSLAPGLAALTILYSVVRYTRFINRFVFLAVKSRILMEVITEKRFFRAFCLVLSMLPTYFLGGKLIGKDLKPRFDSIEREIRERIDRQMKSALKKVVATRRFWIAVIVFFLFFTSISASALLGEFDARRGARSLSGNRHLSTAFIYSEQEINTLREHLYESDEEVLVYGPLYILSSDSDTLLLTEPKPQSSEESISYYQHRPALYAVMRDEIEGFTLSTSTPP